MLVARATRLRRLTRNPDIRTGHAAIRTLATGPASVGPRRARGVWAVREFFQRRSALDPRGVLRRRMRLSLGMAGHDDEVGRVQSRPERKTKRSAERKQANKENHPM